MHPKLVFSACCVGDMLSANESRGRALGLEAEFYV
jgi:hypothetical protein